MAKHGTRARVRNLTNEELAKRKAALAAAAKKEGEPSKPDLKVVEKPAASEQPSEGATTAATTAVAPKSRKTKYDPTFVVELIATGPLPSKRNGRPLYTYYKTGETIGWHLETFKTAWNGRPGVIDGDWNWDSNHQETGREYHPAPIIKIWSPADWEVRKAEIEKAEAKKAKK